MDRFLKSGLCLGLGLALGQAAVALADDIQWRPAGATGSTPIQHVQDAPVRQTTFTGVNPLGRPSPLDLPPLVRAKTEADAPQPLPPGSEGKSPTPVVIISDDPKP